MPIYEYRCAACGFQKEYLQKLSDPRLTVCPECGKETFDKMLTAAGFQLKGSGWYATDFKNSGKTTATSTGSTKAGEGAAKTETKTDSSAKPEPAAKAEPAAKPAPAAASGTGSSGT